MNKSDIALFEGLQGQTFLNGYNYDDDYCCVLMSSAFDRPRLYGYVITGRPLPSDKKDFKCTRGFKVVFYQQIEGKTCVGFETYYSDYVDEPDATYVPYFVGAVLEYASTVSALVWHFANYSIRLRYPVPSDNPKKQYVSPMTWQDFFAMQQTIIEAIKPYCTMFIAELPND